MSLFLGAVGTSATPVAAQETHLVLVTGLGGDPAYTETFTAWASELRGGALEAGVRPERIYWLGEDPGLAEGISGRSTRENLEDHLELLAGAAGAGDRVLLVLIGHGTARGDEARFNLPGPDITGGDLAPMLDRFGGQTVAVVNTAPSSGPWVEALAAPGRIVVTATKTAAERNETQFGGYFAGAFRGEEADLDKDGRVSLLEAFRFAGREVERHYEERNLLVTEHAVLDDDGDGRGAERFGEAAGAGAAGQAGAGEATSDGELAARFWLAPRLGVVAGSPDAAVPAGVTDPELRALYVERAELERQVAELRARKDEMDDATYQERLESLLIEVALKNRAIREKEGGGGAP